MAYWGYKTPRSFALWIVVIVLLITGAIWLIIGGATVAQCERCRSQFGKNLTADVDPRGVDKDCKVAAFAFALYEPSLTTVADSRDNFYSWCLLSTGPTGQLAAGGTMFLLGLIFMTIFCCLSAPKEAREEEKAISAEAVKA